MDVKACRDENFLLSPTFFPARKKLEGAFHALEISLQATLAHVVWVAGAIEFLVDLYVY